MRAFAVGTVVLCHLQQRFFLLPFQPIVWDGVEVFFVLSGFLITTILLSEIDRERSLLLTRFYSRRAFRILPPVFVYLAVVVLVCVISGRIVPWPSILGASLFVSDLYPRTSSFFTEHVWSLAVEEQFYIFWPVILLWAMRLGKRRRAAQVCLLLIGLSPLFRVASATLGWSFFTHRQSMMLPGRMDSLFSGSLAAICIGSPRYEAFYQRLKGFWWVLPLFILVISPILRAAVGNPYTLSVGYTLESISCAAFIVWVVRSPEHLVVRALSWQPIVYIGGASYSIYLYQSLLIHPWPGQFWNASPYSVLLAVLLVGLAGFYLVEVPMLKLRSRLGKPLRVVFRRSFGRTTEALEKHV